MATDAEVRRRDGGSRRGPGIRNQRRRNGETLDAGSLVTALGLEPQQPELVPGKQVDVVAGLALDSITVGVGRRSRGVSEGDVIVGALR